MGNPNKADIKKEMYPDGSIKCTPLAYTDRDDLPAEIDAVVVAAALHDCMEPQSHPEYTAVFTSCTGRYFGPRYAVCVNQAGHHLELWISRFDDTSVRSHHYAAEFDPTLGYFRVHAHGDRGTTLGLANPYKSDGEKKLNLWWEDAAPHEDEHLVQFDNRATRSPAAVDALRRAGMGKADAIADGALVAEHAPISAPALLRLEAALVGETEAGKQFYENLAALFRIKPDHDSSTTHAVATALKRLDWSIWRALVETGFRDSSEELTDQLKNLPADAKVRTHETDRVARHTRMWLAATHVTLETWTEGPVTERRTMYEWMQRALHYSKNFGAVPLPRPWITQWFGVPPGGKFRYECEVNAFGYGLDIGLPFGKWIGEKLQGVSGFILKKILESDLVLRFPFLKAVSKTVLQKVISKGLGYIKASGGGVLHIGELTIRSTNADKRWEERYLVSWGGTGVGKEGGGLSMPTFHARGFADTNVEWQPQTFVGSFQSFGGYLAGSQHGKKSAKQAIWSVEGSGTDAAVQIVWDDPITVDANDVVTMGLGSIDEKFKIAPLPDRVAGGFVNYSNVHVSASTTHFRLGSATIRDEGRHALRTLAALELHRFRRRRTQCNIEGFADRIGARWFNDALSYSRARHCEAALRDCLGREFRAHVSLHGSGERVLEALNELFDFPDDSASPEWRRVFVVLDGSVGVSLFVPDKVGK
ncbi:MAG: hypothetical protein JKY37_23500 [Nannocystaceae bacterium]|nr:hypothetical protein [Nannocystaceae bacterium]